MENNHVAVLKKMFQIVEFLAGCPSGASLNRISVSVDMNKSTVYRILHTMVANGYAIQNPSTTEYRLGYKFLRLAAVLQDTSIQDIAHPFMRRFTDETLLATSLVQLQGDQIVTIYVVEPRLDSAIKVSPSVGFFSPLHCTASGKLFLSCLSKNEFEQYIKSHPLTSVCLKTITDETALRNDLEAIRERGYSIENQENEPNIVSLSAPICNRFGKILNTLSVMTLAIPLNGMVLDALGTRLLDYACQISTELGCLDYYDTIHHLEL